jgi:hypothetical protein
MTISSSSSWGRAKRRVMAGAQFRDTQVVAFDALVTKALAPNAPRKWQVP